jgi:hypothetical protein
MRAELPLYKERGRQAVKPQCVKLLIFQETRWRSGSNGKMILNEAKRIFMLASAEDYAKGKAPRGWGFQMSGVESYSCTC